MDSSDVSRRVQCHRIRGGTVAHMSANNVLVVSATKSEAAYVPQGCELLVTGIGKVSAATAVASALARYERDDLPLVVNIGTAGALHAQHGGLYVPGVVINHDISSTAIRALGHDVADRLVLAGGDDSVLAPTLQPGTPLHSEPIWSTWRGLPSHSPRRLRVLPADSSNTSAITRTTRPWTGPR